MAGSESSNCTACVDKQTPRQILITFSKYRGEATLCKIAVHKNLAEGILFVAAIAPDISADVKTPYAVDRQNILNENTLSTNKLRLKYFSLV
jgi:hypothetical protein